MKFKVGQAVRIVGHSIGRDATGSIEEAEQHSDYVLYLVRYDSKVVEDETGHYFESQLTRV